jgi:DNA-binding MarR family transcriptional regulator
MSSDNESSTWIIAEVARLMRKIADRRFEPLGLTRAQWQALGYLRRCGPMPQTVLADAMEVETATIARLIDRLEGAGWVDRSADAADRRVKLVAITEKSASVMEELNVIGQELREELLSDLSAEDREHLMAMLLKIKSRLLVLLGAP